MYSLTENDIYHTNIEKRLVYSMRFFAKQCSLLANESELPDSLPYRTNKRLRHVEISERKIVELINHLIPNKANGCETYLFKC